MQKRNSELINMRLMKNKKIEFDEMHKQFHTIYVKGFPFQFIKKILFQGLVQIVNNLFVLYFVIMKAEHPSLQDLSEQNLKQLSEKVFKGCGCIYHMQGYMNSKGDAPYDFTCNRSHRCPKCSQQYTRIINKLNSIAEEKQLKENTKLVQAKLQKTKAKYFEPKQGCECTVNSMCKPCFQFLQNEVTRLQSGCGKQWEQQFGGMAAGPAYVTCYQNYFLCDTCSEQLAFINRINKEYPWVLLKHIPEGEKDFWKGPSQKPYYAGIL